MNRYFYSSITGRNSLKISLNNCEFVDHGDWFHRSPAFAAFINFKLHESGNTRMLEAPIIPIIGPEDYLEISYFVFFLDVEYSDWLDYYESYVRGTEYEL